MFAELLCEDLQLEYHKFTKPIAESIRAQILDFESIQESELPNGGNNQIVEINVSMPFERERKSQRTEVLLL